MTHTEEELIAGCRKGDRKMQHELYQRFAGKMFVVCLRYVQGQLEAEDVLQEAFIKVFNKLEQYRAEASLTSWIKRIVVNTALNHQRGKLYMYPMVDVENMHGMAGQELTLSGYHFQDLLRLIQELPSGCRVIFNLYAIEGYNHKEIAELLKISEGTSKSQYARARQLLQSRIVALEKNGYEKVK
nr:RNA polymerase sigma factor [Nafulsella turpanensis]